MGYLNESKLLSNDYEIDFFYDVPTQLIYWPIFERKQKACEV